MRAQVKKQADRIVEKLLLEQSLEGTWEYPFETGILTDCYMIILFRTLDEKNEEELIRSLVRRILKEQYTDGAWRLFYDVGNGHLSLTVNAYYALLLSGYVKKESASLLKAKQFIIANGGIQETNSFTKALLSLTGNIEWEHPFPLPVEAVLLPKEFPINFYDISVFARANLAPLLIIADYKYVIKPVNAPSLSELQTRKNRGTTIESNSRSILTFIEQGIEQLIDFKEDIHEKALLYLEQYLVDHIEPDGTLYSYFSSTFYMIFAFLARGRRKDDPLITNAINGLKSMICIINGENHCQYTTATVWNTSLISTAIQFYGISYEQKQIEMANKYLIGRQQKKMGDWGIHNLNLFPGGWGFSNVNTMNPDVDDTTASLRAIHRLVIDRVDYREVWDKGVQWILSMQNDDGGWPAFEKNVDNPLLKLLPYGEGLLLDASSPDLTGRTLEFLGNYTNINPDHLQIKKGIKWLINKQETNGSWNSRWGIDYIYGTWAAIQGLQAVGLSSKHPSIILAQKWLENIQNDDGGWGESCRSDIVKQYVPLGYSTLTHTAWALEALITISEYETSFIRKGINFLIHHADIKDWRSSYPAGQGMGGEFYIHYHSYQFIWPLMALVRYLKKFSN